MEKYLEVSAGVRYWEDASLNGKEDTEGKMPCRNGDNWCPIIELGIGKIINWEEGNFAEIHYKVCDDGEYYLLDENKKRIQKEKNYYVPDDLLCPVADGYGDYIIMKINEEGFIEKFNYIIDNENWEDIKD